MTLAPDQAARATTPCHSSRAQRAAARCRQRRAAGSQVFGQRDRLVGPPGRERSLDRAQGGGRSRPLVDTGVVQQGPCGGRGRLRPAALGCQPHPCAVSSWHRHRPRAAPAPCSTASASSAGAEEVPSPGHRNGRSVPVVPSQGRQIGERPSERELRIEARTRCTATRARRSASTGGKRPAGAPARSSQRPRRTRDRAGQCLGGRGRVRAKLRDVHTGALRAVCAG